jgi:hypothetical protein
MLPEQRIVATDPINSGVQSDLPFRPALTSHLRRAGARERHGKEKQKRVLVSEIVAEPDLLWSGRDLGGQREIWRFGSNGKWHK